MTSGLDWLQQRTGLVGWLRRLVYEPIPGGPRWRHVWGTVLLFTFFIQITTGFFLLAAYSASTQSAWESVFHLQFHTPGGWLLRGVHSVAAQFFVVLLALHLMQVVICHAYLAPREVNFWLLLALAPLLMGASVTGWLLPFDQQGFWAARVPLNLLGVVPVAGPKLQQLLLGGPEFSHHTLTRFLALHVALLPALVGLTLGLYCYLARRHAATSPSHPAETAGGYYPDQMLKDAVACLAVLAVVLFLVVRPRLLGHTPPGGVALGPPADPTETFSAARPEWFMLFLFQFLKFFPGRTEIWGAVVIPHLVLAVIALMPWIGKWRYGRGFNRAFILALLMAAAMLTWAAVRQDHRDPDYQAAVREAETAAQRVRVLAEAPTGIPPAGALTLLRNDPFTQGPKLFARHCASCHRFDGQDGLGHAPKDPPSASDLKGFASRAWVAGLLDPQQVASQHYFGGTKFNEGKMVRFVRRDLADLSTSQKDELRKVAAAVSAEAGLKSQRALEAQEAAVIAAGKALITGGHVRCTECHQFHKPDQDATAPDLTGYGSRDWLTQFLTNPGHDRFYGQRSDRMPAFGAEGILDARELALVVDWLRGEW